MSVSTARYTATMTAQTLENLEMTLYSENHCDRDLDECPRIRRKPLRRGRISSDKSFGRSRQVLESLHEELARTCQVFKYHWRPISPMRALCYDSKGVLARDMVPDGDSTIGSQRPLIVHYCSIHYQERKDNLFDQNPPERIHGNLQDPFHLPPPVATISSKGHQISTKISFIWDRTKRRSLRSKRATSTCGLGSYDTF